MGVLQIRNLSIVHKKDLHPMIKNFTYSLNPGEKAVLIGEEGNGKSTLLRLIYDSRLVEDYIEWEGEISHPGLRLGYLPQELPAVQKEQGVLEFLSELPQFYEKTPKELGQIAAELGVPLELFYSEQKLGTLSGGEKVKLQIAKIRLEEPDILLLDEPSNDIDLETLAWLERFIRESREPVLFVSHDELLIERTATVILHLEQLRRKTIPRHTIARMPYEQYIRERQSRFSHQEQVARKERSDYEKQMEKFRQIQQKVEHQQSVISRQNPAGGRLLKKKMHTVQSMGRRFERERENMTGLPEEEEAIFSKLSAKEALPNGKQVLQLELPVLRQGDRILARDIRLQLRGAEKICIVGKNGVGKTTLLKEIAGLLFKRPDLAVDYMPQDYDELFAKREQESGKTLTPVEFLAKTWEKEELTRIRTYLGSMKYTAEEMEHSVTELSGGQKAKLLFLGMSMNGSNVLILDEPTRNFSPLSGPVIRGILKGFNGCIISISHDRKYIREVCDRIYRLTEAGLEEADLEKEL